MYSENGTLSQMYTYRNGKLNGPSKLYNKSGEVIESGNYKNGRRKGLWKYFKNGQLEKTKKFPLKDPASERRTGEPEGYKDGGKPDMSEIRK
jgi:antitoxin component YwqK of YwqJK toxin-antitoxin module